jgi:hypothetical protein
VNTVIIIKTKTHLSQTKKSSLTLISYLDPLVFLLQKTFLLFDSLIFWCWENIWNYISSVEVVIIWYLDLQLPVQLVPITTKVVSSNPVHGEMYSIQHYWIKFGHCVRYSRVTIKDYFMLCIFRYVKNDNNNPRYRKTKEAIKH